MDKKLLFLVNVDWFFISHRLPIALKAIEEGYDVHVACCDTGACEKLVEAGITVHRINFSRAGNSIFRELLTLYRVFKVIRSLNPSILHSVTIKPVLYSGLILRFFRDPPAYVAAISGLGYAFSASTFRSRLIKGVVSLLYKAALSHSRVKVIFQNKSDELTLKSIVSLPEQNVTLIKGSGVDLHKYKAIARSSFGSIKVVMASRLLKEKGVYDFVEAARIVTKQDSDIQFILAGPIDQYNPNGISAEEIQHWDSEGLIKAVGQCNDIPQLFASSDIVTLPSYYGEGLPKVLIEAAACGCPIITTDNPGCLDAVIPEQTGLVVPAKDPVRLAEAILRLANSPAERVAMGLAARRFAVEEFDVDSVVSKHLSIYLELAEDC